MKRFLSFDLEIAKTLPNDNDLWDAYRPFGISVACVVDHAWRVVQWPAADKSRITPYNKQLTRYEADRVADYLFDKVALGYTIMTWNGLGFDFRVLAEECSPGIIPQQLAALAMSAQHVDIGFAMVCDLGYMCSLQHACDGMGLPGKTEGISGLMLPDIWNSEDLAKQELCLEYSRNDVCITSVLYQAIEYKRQLTYTTRAGRKQIWVYPTANDNNILSVTAALKLSDVSNTRWPRTKFTGWAQALLQG